MKSFRDYLGLSNSCLYDVDDVISRVDRFGFQNFCSPGTNCLDSAQAVGKTICYIIHVYAVLFSFKIRFFLHSASF